MSTPPEGLSIRPVTVADAGAVVDIYNHYVNQTVITFEEEAVSADEMARRIQEVGAAGLPWLIATSGAEILGYAYANKWKARSAYRFAVEITVYLDPRQSRRGIGSRLYDQLIPLLGARGIRTLIGVIALPNQASVALHEKFGLEKAAHFKEVGWKFNRWIDVGYWQRNLPATSEAVSQ